MPKKKPGTTQTTDRVTYRDLRNTPGRVWERLADKEMLTLIADGEAKAILVPVENGDVRSAYEAFTRGQAMLAASRLRRKAREAGTNKLSLSDINAVIGAARDKRNRSNRGK